MPGPARNQTKDRSRAYRADGNNTTSRRGLTVLPADGCSLPVPSMPAGRTWSDVEQARWGELWSSPQATQWDESVRGTVALLVSYESRLLCAEGGTAWVAQEARYAAEALGLTPRAMATLGWVLSE